MITAHRTANGYILMSQDGVIVPLTKAEAMGIYYAVAEDLARDRQEREAEEQDA